MILEARWRGAQPIRQSPPFRRMLSKIGGYEAHMLVVFVLLAGAIWASIELADEVNEGSTASLDEIVLLALRSLIGGRDIAAQVAIKLTVACR